MKLIEDLTDEEFSKLELPFPLDTLYWIIADECDIYGIKGKTVINDIFTDCDCIDSIKYLRENLGKTVFLNEDEAYEQLKLIK